ncbi:MAG: NAD-dependent epimerase/dehydratase family protein [Candidatus Obscuribacterales bacterium]|nr:NAD-dependent epimerase/dehydratase family protein [Candidatus Obscuribacterales bacterium]
MKVLVIGGTGFIGTHVVKSLLENDHEPSVLHRGRSQVELPTGALSVIGDRALLKDMSRVVNETKPDVIIDMIPRTAQESWSLISSARDLVSRIVVVSSIDVYRAYNRLRKVEPGKPDPTPLKEDAPLREILFPYRGNAVDALHLSYMYEKILVERLALSEPSIPSTIVRLPVVFGPSDPQTRIYDYLRRMNDKRPFILMGDRQARWKVTRGFVTDVARAVALCAQDQSKNCRIFNTGQKDPVNEYEWVKMISRAASWKGEIITIDDDAMPEHIRQDYDWGQDLTIDSSRIRDELGFRESVDIEKALSQTIEWQTKNPPSDKSEEPINYAAEDQQAASAKRFANIQ